MPDALIGAEAVERLVRCASTLPASAGRSIFGFEMRLEDNAPLCDFFLDVPPDSPLGADLAERGRSAHASPTDRSLGGLLWNLRRNGSSLSRWFGRVILEYDLIEGGHRGRFHPGLFLTPACEVGDKTSAQSAGPEALTAALCSGVGWPEDQPEIRGVTRILDAMPGDARLTYVGVLPVRTPRAIRLLLNMRPDDVADYLDRIGWSGHHGSTARALSLASPGFGGIVVAMDVTGGTVSPRIGFELHLDDPWWTVTPSDYRDFVELCVAEGWCLPSKARALEIWPRRESLFGTHGMVRFFSGMNHFKLTIDDQTVSVKAYAGARFLFPETGRSR